MADLQLLEKIIVDPKIMVGKPIIKGTRITVQLILNMLAQGISMDEILQDYPHITKEDIMACLVFASKTIDDIKFMTISAH